MRATKYDKRITIQKGTRVDNDIGGFSMSYSDLYKAWANLRSLTGTARLEFGMHGIAEAYEVEMRRRRVDPDSECQVLFEGRAFQITSLNHDRDHTYMVITR